MLLAAGSAETSFTYHPFQTMTTSGRDKCSVKFYSGRSSHETAAISFVNNSCRPAITFDIINIVQCHWLRKFSLNHPLTQGSLSLVAALTKLGSPSMHHGLILLVAGSWLHLLVAGGLLGRGGRRYQILETATATSATLAV